MNGNGMDRGEYLKSVQQYVAGWAIAVSLSGHSMCSLRF